MVCTKVDHFGYIEVETKKLEVKEKKYEMKKVKEENRILFTDPNSITDPIVRENLRNEQARIMRKRAEQEKNQMEIGSSNGLGQLFDFVGSDNDLPNY